MAKWVDFRTVREGLDFRAVLAHYGLDEHGAGDQLKIICPFHNDHKPSCGINLIKQVYHCFACDGGGNALDFVAHMEGHDPEKPVELRKAAMAAAEIFGIDEALERVARSQAKVRPGGEEKATRQVRAKPQAKVQPKTAHAKAKRPDVANDNAADQAERSELVQREQDDVQAVNKPLSFALQLDPNHSYIEERGFDAALLKSFGIGHASKGMMQGRVCFPIHNGQGELIAYSGRWADDDLPEDVPRYLLPKGFAKNQVDLYRFCAGHLRV